MSASAFFHVESPYVIRNLRERIKVRQTEMLTYFRNAIEWDMVTRTQGRMQGLEDVLAILDELEQKENN